MKLLFSFLTMLIVSLSFVSNSFAAPTPPVMSHSTNGARVDITWTEVSGATGYTLLYAPSPYAGPKTIQSKDMGTKTSLSANLWDGAAYYVAVQAYNEQGNSGYSNIELLKIETISAPKLSVSTDGVTVSLSWDSVPGATGYLLNYGPSPFAGPESFITKDVGLTTNFSTDLWDGAVFSVAVQAYNDSGISDFSNIERFILAVSTDSDVIIITVTPWHTWTDGWDVEMGLKLYPLLQSLIVLGNCDIGLMKTITQMGYRCIVMEMCTKSVKKSLHQGFPGHRKTLPLFWFLHPTLLSGKLSAGHQHRQLV